MNWLIDFKFFSSFFLYPKVVVVAVELWLNIQGQDVQN